MLLKAIALIASGVAIAQGGSTPTDRFIVRLQALRPAASEAEFRYQPAMLFDDSCYNSVAIDLGGFTNPGLWHHSLCPNDGCREEHQLLENNVYSRMRCNNDICAILYAYYFLKDQTACGSWGVGHQHDWENIVVFVRRSTGDIVLVAPSAHRGYSGRTRTPLVSGDSTPLIPADSPLVAYHQDGGLTHKMRMGHEDDRWSGNGYGFGPWFLGSLVGWDHWPNEELREGFLEAFDGGIAPKLDDKRFGAALEKAADGFIDSFEFDPWVDDFEEEDGLEWGEWVET